MSSFSSIADSNDPFDIITALDDLIEDDRSRISLRELLSISFEQFNIEFNANKYSVLRVFSARRVNRVIGGSIHCSLLSSYSRC